jgi:hypothetical protein
MATVLVLIGWAAIAWRHRSTDVRRVVPTDLGPFPAVLFFSSDTCDSCPPAREVVVAAAGGRLRDYTWQVHPGVLRRLRVDAVPTTWVVDGDGRVEAVFAGRPEPGEVSGAVARAGIDVDGPAG